MKAFFIVGVGRSGTSLLQSMMASHPQMGYMPETGFLRRYLITGKLIRILKKRGVSGLRRQLDNDEVLERLHFELGGLAGCNLGNPRLADKSMYLQMLERHQVDACQWVGDKDPRLIEFLPVIPHIIGQFAIINVIRDPRDILLSKKKASWSKKGHIWKHVFANRVQIKLGNKFRKRAPSSIYREILYEDLISCPRDVLTDICNMIGLRFNGAMLEFGDVAKELAAEDERSWKKETFGPLLTENKDKWRFELSDREIVLTELCCGTALEMGNYHRAGYFKKLSLADKLWVAGGVSSVFLLELPYRIYRAYTVGRTCARLSL